LIDKIAEKLLSSSNISRNLVVFPGKRPAHFLRKALAGRLGAHPSPGIMPMDAFVDFLAGEEKPEPSELDLAAVLYEEMKKETLAIFGLGDLELDSFLPWAFKLISDLEEIKIELKTEKDLSAFDEILPGEMRGPASVKKIKKFSALYSAFYKKIVEKGQATRSMKYAALAEKSDFPSLSKFENIILAGFFAFTAAERKMIKALSKIPGFLLISREGPGIKEQFSFLDSALKAGGESAGKGVKLKFYKSSDIHGEVMKLREILSKEKAQDLSQSVAVLPSADSLFPLLHNSLADISGYNISMGYPAKATPVYTLINSLAELLDRKSGDKYFIPVYLRFVFHPYVKNIYMLKSAETSRIIFQTAEEVLSKQPGKYRALEEIENDREIVARSLEKFAAYSGAGPGAEKIKEHLKLVHDKLVRPFERIADIGDFAEKLLEALSFISENGTAHLHPYWSAFAGIIMENIQEIKNCILSSRGFSNISSYFKFLANALNSVSYPFPGTPLKGFQVLGFLETRGLKFKKVYFLDANADMLPAARKEDTLLSHFIRENLGLSTYKKREKISAYYFFTLINSAEEAHIFYKDNEEKERSPFVEKLVWELLKRKEKPKEEDIYFNIKFSRREPKASAKNEEMINRLLKREYSPSALDAYLSCGLRFYNKYLLNLSEKDEISPEIEQKDIGSIVHDILEKFFKKKIGRPLKIHKEDYKLIKKISEEVFAVKMPEHNRGYEYVVKRQVERRLEDLLEYHEEKLSGIKILDCERDLETEIETRFGKIKLKGRADRVQQRGALTEIVDYKTGARAEVPNWKEFDLNDRANWIKTLKSVQLPFYALAYKNVKGLSVENIDAYLMLLGSEDMEEKRLFGKIYGKTPGDKAGIFSNYEKAIKILIEEILDVKKKFVPVSPENAKECSSCPYKTICGRQWA